MAYGSLVAEMEFLQCSPSSDRKKLQRATPILPAIVVSQTQKNPKKKPVAGVTGDRGRTSSQALAPIWIEQWTQQTSNVRVTRRAIKTVLAGAKHMSEQEQTRGIQATGVFDSKKDAGSSIIRG